MAAVEAASLAHHLLHILLLLLLVATNDATVFSILNDCSYTVWPAATPIGGGFELEPGEKWILQVPAGTSSGRIWGRTGCSFSPDGRGTCETADCGGVLSCLSGPKSNATLAEYSLSGTADFFDLAMLDGFNLPMAFLPAKEGPECSMVLRCEGNSRSQCPDGYINTSDQKTHSCPSNTDYEVIFCPPIDLQPMHATHQGMEEAEEYGELQGTPVRFTFQQLKVATEDFRDELGGGGFGTVFKGQFGEDIIAVKRLDQTGQGKREFLAEVQTIGSIHHINLVRLIGFCAEKSHRLLVYEFMPKGSLDRWIYHRQGNNTLPLDWSTRCKIITHIAKGLCYLHEECAKRIAHLDVKPQNILLDDDFNAKLSDFGMCKLIDRDTSQVITRMRGTPGYLAPEWLTSQITEKADIYSFGVVIMEIISGRKNIDTSRSEESVHLVTLLEEKVKNGQLADLIHEHSNDLQVQNQEVIEMMKLAM